MLNYDVKTMINRYHRDKIPGVYKWKRSEGIRRYVFEEDRRGILGLGERQA
jgi:hypothetical protein